MDLTEYNSENRVNSRVESKVPPRAKEEPCWLGIDEAGRGPVLGPMVYGVCYSPISDKEKFKEMGFADSKTLTEEKREELLASIDGAGDTMGYIVDILSPNYISNSMLRRFKYNLNAVSHDTAISMIKRALELGVNVKEVYVDTVGLPEKYQAKLKEIFPDLDITVAKKADALYPIVSAASICAKVARDRVVHSWTFREGIEIQEGHSYGSGYPGDAKTKSFLQENLDPVFGFSTFVRFSWSTAEKMLEDKAVSVSWEDDEDEDSDLKGVPAITSYFGGSKARKSHTVERRKHPYFRDRCLEQLKTY